MSDPDRSELLSATDPPTGVDGGSLGSVSHEIRTYPHNPWGTGPTSKER